MSAKLTKYEWDEFPLCRIHIVHIICKSNMFIEDIFSLSGLYVRCTSTPTSSTGRKLAQGSNPRPVFLSFGLYPKLNPILFAATARSSYRWGYRGPGWTTRCHWVCRARQDRPWAGDLRRRGHHLSPEPHWCHDPRRFHRHHHIGEQTCTPYPSLVYEVDCLLLVPECEIAKWRLLLQERCHPSSRAKKSDTILWSGYAADYYLEEKHLWSPMSFMFFSWICSR